MIGRRIEVIADLHRVRVFCEGRLVADHARSGPGTRPSPTPTMSPLRRRCAANGSVLLRPVAEPRGARQRCLADYDTALGLDRHSSVMAAMAARRPSHAATRDLTGEVAFLTRALKAPTLRESVARLAERARAESWSHEEFLVACLQREVAARESHGGEGRIRAARFPARKSLEEFDFDHARGLKRDLIAHLEESQRYELRNSRGEPSWTWASWKS